MVDLFGKLPEGFRKKFMQQVISRTTPADAMRLSVVSKSFQSAADSDFVWDSFLPSQHKILAEVELSWIFPSFSSAKEYLLFLCVYTLHQDGTFKSLGFWLDKWSGKRCMLIPYNKLRITQLETDFWKTDFGHYPELGHVVWLEIQGKISTSMLSPNTSYTAYLVYDLSNYFCYGLHLPVETCIGISGEEYVNHIVYLDPRTAKSQSDCQYPKQRNDKLWLEVEMGDYFNKEGESRYLEMTVREVKSGRPKCGAIISGIEIRVKRADRDRFIQNC